MTLIKGKQINAASIEQPKMNITTSSIISNTNITNKEYVDQYITNQVSSINYSQLNLNMIALATSGSGIEWSQQTEPTQTYTNYLYSVAVVNSNTAYAVGSYNNGTNDAAYILKTTNGGTNWIQQTEPTQTTTNYLWSISVVDSNTTYAVGVYNNGSIYTSYIIKTTDGGTNWIQQTEPTQTIDNYVQSISVVDSNTAYAVGVYNNGSIYTSYIIKTTDGGTNWVQQTEPTQSNNNYLYSISVVDSNTAYAVGVYNNGSIQSSYIIKTTDGGTNWIQQTEPTQTIDNYLESVSVVDSNTAYAVGQYNNGSFTSSYIIKTTDGGTNWTQQTEPTQATSNYLQSISVVDSNTAYAVGQYNNGSITSSYIIKTTDGGGTNWIQQTEPTQTNTNYLQSISVVDSNTAYAVGRYNNGSITSSYIFKGSDSSGPKKATDKYVIEYPISGIKVNINGIEVNVGGKTTPYDCYFSSDSGLTVKTIPQKGDNLYWNNLNYQLDSNDEVDLVYLVNQKYVNAMSGGTYTLTTNNLVIKFNGNSGSTATIIISGTSFTIGNVAGQFVFDIGGTQEHTFTTIGESYLVSVNGTDYKIIWDGFGSLIFSVEKSGTTAAILDKDIIVGTSDGGVYRLAPDGSEVWSNSDEVGIDVISAIIIDSNNNIVVSTLNYGNIDVLNSEGLGIAGYAVESGVNCLALQSDGKILVGHSTGILRLNTDYTIDNSFNNIITSGINAIVVNSDDTFYHNVYQYISMVDKDGNIIIGAMDAISTINCLVLQSDGKILAGTATGVYRFDIDGSIDDSWTTVGFGTLVGIDILSNNNIITAANPALYFVVLGTDGNYVQSVGEPTYGNTTLVKVNEDSTIYAGYTQGIHRYLQDYSVDETFTSTITSQVNAIALI
jgi:photosystem II stability/assembly factor-like uncharacterized protein